MTTDTVLVTDTDSATAAFPANRADSLCVPTVRSSTLIVALPFLSTPAPINVVPSYSETTSLPTVPAEVTVTVAVTTPP